MAKPRSVTVRAKLRRLLIEARVVGGLKQADLALKLGKTQSYVSKVESGALQLEVVDFIEWVRALGLDPAAFVSDMLAKE